jgi:hypothetical protein
MAEAARAEQRSSSSSGSAWTATALVPARSEALPQWWGPALPDAHRSGDLLIVAAIARCLSLSHDEAAEWLLAQRHPLRFLLCKQLSSTTAKSAWVYLAVDRVLGRPIVLKILDTAAAKEARMLAAVAHPNVVMVHDAGVFEDRTYIVLQWCESGTLTDYARTHAWADVLARCLEAGRALASCHALGFVHGDVKPNNVLIHDDRALLADFGLAGRPREFGPVAGTIAYMPPERDQGVWLPAGDVFAFARTTLVALELSLGPRRTRPRELVELLALLDQAMSDEPIQRPSMARLLDALEQLRTTQARKRPRSRDDWRALAFASAVVSVVALSLGSDYRMQDLLGPGLALARDAGTPSVERAITLLRAGESVGAWEEFLAAERSGEVDLEAALELTRLAVEEAEHAPPDRHEQASRVAQLLALQVITLTVDSGEPELEVAARVLGERAEAAANRE